MAKKLLSALATIRDSTLFNRTQTRPIKEYAL